MQGIGQKNYLPLFDAFYLEGRLGLRCIEKSSEASELEPARERESPERNAQELKYNAGMYVYRAMKKVGEHGCILAAHQFG